nr:retrovirus-related Pol polyprotein from transposon TNT 1-94 [Tanacetum cinerariifolium]
MDERGIVIRNKARLVAQAHTQEHGIDYDEVFATVARIEAIRLFLAYASFKDFVVYQMDVKSAFLYGKIEKEEYVGQPPGFKDPDFPDKVYKVKTALYGLHQAPRAWFSDVKKASTPMETSKPLLKDKDREEVDVHMYRSMIGSVMYLNSSRPNIVVDVYACARYQVTPKVSHLHIVKRIFRYLKGQPKLGLRLIYWQCKKQTVVANSKTKAEENTSLEGRKGRKLRLFPTEIHTHDHVPTTSNDPLSSSEDRMKLKELMDLCTNLSNKVLDLGIEVIEMKSSHKANIKELESRVEKLEEENMVESQTIKETIVDTKESSKQGRKITDIDVDVEVNLENVIEIAKIIVDEVSSAGGELNAANKKLVSDAPINITTTQPSEATKTTVKDKGKAKLVEEPEILKSRKAQIAIDEEVARRIKAEWNVDMKDNIDWNEFVEQVQSRQSNVVRKYQALKRKHVSAAQARKNMMIYLKNMAGYKMDFFKGMSYEEIRPLFEEEYNKVQTLFKEGP